MRSIALLLAAALLSACGFTLKQDFALPVEMQSTFVQVADASTPLQRNLARALRQSGRQVATQVEQASAVLQITRNQMIQDVLSVGDQARVREFEIRYEVDMRLLGADGQELLASQSLRLTRDYRFDETQLIGAAGEEELIRGDLERDMVRLIMERLESLSAATRNSSS